VTELPVLGRDALPDLAALCARSLPDPPSIDELDAALFAPLQPAVVRGDPATAVVATVAGRHGAYIRLLVVDRAARGLGHGHALVRAAHGDARAGGHSSITTGSDAPYFLWPGVPSGATEMLCLFERHKYQRVEANFDMTIDLTALPDDPGGHALATPADHDQLDAWAAMHWANWRLEVLRALEKNNLVIARDDTGITAICAFEVNRTGFLGPVAARPDLIGRGVGRPPLIGALHELRRRGRTSIDVCWVGPVVPYAALGGQVSNVYFVYRKELA
jgi:GNAT superfamily N-acetyltransferase